MLQITKILTNNRENVTAVEKAPSFTLYIVSDGGQVTPKALWTQVQDITLGTAAAEVLCMEVTHLTLHDIRLPEAAVLVPHHTYRVRFRIEDSEGGTAFSRWSSFHYAYDRGAKWRGSFLSASCPEEEERDVAPVFEFFREFNLPEETVSAQLYITAFGMYTACVNGRRVGNDALCPGWFTYDQHLAYQVYDILPLLRDGANRLSVMVGDGWYKGYLTSSWHRNYYGSRRQLLWELHLRGKDSEESVIASDGKCLWRRTAVRMSEIYSGEICDNTTPEEPWKPVTVQPWPKGVDIHVSTAAPAHYRDPISPRRILRTPRGETVVDFGRVISGVVEVTASMPRGTTLLMEFGDTLGPDGCFYNENVELFSLKENDRPSVQKVSYTFSGEGRERYRPTFTYQCFRYMRISGTPWPLERSAFLAYPITSFTEQTGTFACGDGMVNRIFQNTVNTQMATFLDIPVAGPMRAERLGWTGDNQLMFPLAMRTMYDSYSFLGKWLEEVRHSQGDDGQVGTLAPYVNFQPGSKSKDFAPEASAIWGDAAVICPWLLYEFYGDKEILRRYRNLAKGYVDYMRGSGDCETTFTEGETFGDWFALDNGEDAYPGITDKAFLGNVYYYRSTVLLGKILKSLEDPMEGEYAALAERIRTTIEELYFEDGALKEPTQAAAALTIAFGIAREPEKVGRQLCKLLEQSGGHLLTGFAGTSVVLQALCQIGRQDLALKAVSMRGYPSWIDTIEKGATTIWEHFNGVKTDGSYWSPNMNSFCHLTFGSVVEWMFGYLLGIRQEKDSVAYEKILIDPVMDPGLGWAEGGMDTVFGRVSTRWTYRQGECTLTAEIPYGARATAVLRDVEDIPYVIRKLNREGYHEIQTEGPDVKVSLGWGRHTFGFRRRERKYRK